MELPKEVMDRILSMQRNEVTEGLIYQRIAGVVKKDEEKKTLLRIAEEEKGHAEIWKTYTGQDCKPNMRRARWYTLLARRIMGLQSCPE